MDFHNQDGDFHGPSSLLESASMQFAAPGRKNAPYFFSNAAYTF